MTRPLKLLRLPSLRFAHVSIDMVLVTLSLLFSLYLRVGYEVMLTYKSVILFYIPLFIVVRLISFYVFGTYKVIWRYVSARDAVTLTQAVMASSCVLLAISFLISAKYGVLPRSVYFIDACLLTLLMMVTRLARRLVYESRSSAIKVGAPLGRRTLIYGAGTHGKALGAQLRGNPGSLALLGFLDDDPRKQGLYLDGMRVWGGLESLEGLLKDLDVQELLISQTLPTETLRRVVQASALHNIRPHIIRDLDSELGNKLRQVNLDDLLNRTPVQVDRGSIRKMFAGKKVLVTGAGGSIGSEISRQILGFEPGRLLLLDHSEYSLFEIDRELRVSSNSLEHIVPLLVDLKDKGSLSSVFKKYDPDVVIHAAAYKHVHLVESNPYSAILNNIMGTQQLLDLCLQYSVENFLLVSTDKAVNPVGVMGATKRVCELLTTLASIESGLPYSSVRFGNVLGSSGSLIPTLQEQINKGGPVTVTDQEMTRFFMLIPEAVSLVLKSATIAAPGDVNILKMGEPVRILDIARNLIALNGKTEEQIPIVFTGARPGEKLFEELYIQGHELKTEHPDILTLPLGDSDLNPADRQLALELQASIKAMIEFAEQSDEQVLSLLNDLLKTNLKIRGQLQEFKV